MTPRHHVSDETLADYSSGRSQPGSALAIVCHLTLCPPCRARLETIEGAAAEGEADMKGEVVPAPTAGDERLPPVELRSGALEAILERLDRDEPAVTGTLRSPAAEGHAGAEPRRPPSPAARPPLAYGLPPAVVRFFPGVAAMRWRFLAPGAHFIELGGTSGPTAVRLLKLRPGLQIPLHDHLGVEYTVIFTGALTEAGMRFGRGDVAVRWPGEAHVQRVAPGQDCVALQVNEGPLKPLTLKGKLLNLIAGH